MAPQGTQGRAATWAEIAALPGKNKAPGNTTTRPTMPPKNAIAPAKTQQTGHAGRKGSPEDRRVLITMPSERLLTRPEAYAVRQALVGCVPGLDSMGSIPEVSRTNTGWAVTPANQATRDLLMRGESIKAICQTLGATGVNLPQKWLNYAVPGVPSTIRDHEGKPMETGPLIADEAYYQTGLKPVSCRPSRHGADPKTGRTTWIVSFLERPPSFRLFNTILPRSALFHRLLRHMLNLHNKFNFLLLHRPTPNLQINRSHSHSLLSNKTLRHRNPNHHNPNINNLLQPAILQPLRWSSPISKSSLPAMHAVL